VVLLLAASGGTPYALGGGGRRRAAGALTVGLVNNPGAPLAAACRDRHRAGHRARGHQRQHAAEGRHGAEDRAQHLQFQRHGAAAQGLRQPDGGPARQQRQAGAARAAPHGARHRGAPERARDELLPTDTVREFEDRIANLLCPWLAAHDVLLDLHSFRGRGAPFILRGPPDNDGTLEPFAHAAAEGRLAAHLGPTRIVDGWMTAYAAGVARRRERGGPARAGGDGGAGDSDDGDARYGIGTTEYMRSQGGYGVTLECGSHDDPAAPDVGYRAIRQAVALLGLAPLPLAPPARRFDRLQLATVVDRDHARDRFVRPWASFDAVAAGEAVAERADGSTWRAPRAGRIVFPDDSARPGHEWFYFAEPSPRPLLAARSR
jgi:hypothetical protein